MAVADLQDSHRHLHAARFEPGEGGKERIEHRRIGEMGVAGRSGRSRGRGDNRQPEERARYGASRLSKKVNARSVRHWATG